MMRRFVLRRTVDETGLSGTGDVAWGVLFPDGTVVTRWCVTDVRQTCVWRSLDDVRVVHGHNGKTEIVFLDDAAPCDIARQLSEAKKARDEARDDALSATASAARESGRAESAMAEVAWLHAEQREYERLLNAERKAHVQRIIALDQASKHLLERAERAEKGEARFARMADKMSTILMTSMREIRAWQALELQQDEGVNMAALDAILTKYEATE